VGGLVDVLLVSLHPDVTEISALLASAGHRILGTIVQRRNRPDPRSFVGRGKLNEIRERVRTGGVEAIVFNGELRPTMHYLLERELGVECYDRIRVLLELFAQRASSREAKLQVELALLRYEVPLLREWIHEADIGERPGFMAGGEQRVDAYYETVKRRIKKIKDDLEAIRREREVRRALRKDRGYHLVALAGYANAGKSSLLNALTDEHVLVDDRMFSTLATTTRSLAGTRRRILLTDTIGFVDGVPFWMVEAFHATLEEILQADLVLLLVDANDSNDEIRRKVRLAARTFFRRVSPDAVLPLLTKADRLPPERVTETATLLAESEFHRTPLAISVRDGRGLPELREAIHQAFTFPLELHLVLPLDAEASGKMHWLYEHGEVISAAHAPDRIEVVVRCRPRDRDAIERLGRVVLARSAG
jgi:GTPase